MSELSPFKSEISDLQFRQATGISLHVVGYAIANKLYRRAIDFWTRALGYVVSRGGPAARWTELVPAAGPGAALALQYRETPAEEHAANVRRAVARCPRGALSVAEEP